MSLSLDDPRARFATDADGMDWKNLLNDRAYMTHTNLLQPEGDMVARISAPIPPSL